MITDKNIDVVEGTTMEAWYGCVYIGDYDEILNPIDVCSPRKITLVAENRVSIRTIVSFLNEAETHTSESLSWALYYEDGSPANYIVKHDLYETEEECRFAIDEGIIKYIDSMSGIMATVKENLCEAGKLLSP